MTRLCFMKIVIALFVMLSWGSYLQAQLCNGALGSEVYFEGFGSGDNYGPALPAGSTSYNYGSIGDGNYVVTNTAGLNGSLWHDAPDHTVGDVDGYMLLFDASSSPGIFFETTLTGLCGNTNYVFSCYVANIVVPSACGGASALPNLRFELVDPLSNSVLADAETGDIPTSSTMQWEEVGITFHTAQGQNELIVRVRNNAEGGCGNDLALDDFSLHLCNPLTEQAFDLCEQPEGEVVVGSSTYTAPGVYEDIIPLHNTCNDSIVVTTITGEIVQWPTVKLYFCKGDTLEWEGQLYTGSISYTDTIDLPSDCYQLQSYQIIAQEPQLFEQDVFLCIGDSLQVGENWYHTDGTYIDSLQTFVGCDSVVITHITTAGIAVDIQPTSIELELGETLEMTANVTLSTNPELNWLPAESFSCQDCLNPVFQPTSSGIYNVLAIDVPSGCADTAHIEVEVLPCDGLFIPNAFSPNDDGINDFFTLYAKDCYTHLHTFQVFDRWGGLFYSVEDVPLGLSNPTWDGKVKNETASPGIYVYHMVLELLDGTEVEVNGGIHLLR